MTTLSFVNVLGFTDFSEGNYTHSYSLLQGEETLKSAREEAHRIECREGVKHGTSVVLSMWSYGHVILWNLCVTIYTEYWKLTWAMGVQSFYWGWIIYCLMVDSLVYSPFQILGWYFLSPVPSGGKTDFTWPRASIINQSHFKTLSWLKFPSKQNHSYQTYHFEGVEITSQQRRAKARPLLLYLFTT